MAFKLPHHVKGTSTTTGTGIKTIVVAADFFALSSQLSNGDTTWASFREGDNDFEDGIYEFTSPDKLTLVAVYRNTNGGTPINWLAGTRDVVVGMMALPLETLFDPGAPNGLVKRTAANVFGTSALGAAAEALLDDASNTVQRATLGSGAVGDALFTSATIAAALAVLGGTLFTTGDAKLTLKTSETGWVAANDGTIGDASSGATTRANADCEALFTLLWANVSNTWAAVSSGRGASAAADWAAHKTIALPKALGRALAAAGAGSGLTSRALGEILGEETHALTLAENGPHTHDVSMRDGAGAGTVAASSAGAASQVTTTTSSGSGTPHQNMQPTSFWTVLVKL